MDSYFTNLGRFVHMFALAEGMWHVCFRAIAEIPDDVVRAITGGMRGGDLVSILRKVAKTKCLDAVRLAELECLAEQFAVISELRDRLIHRGANPDVQSGLDNWISTNFLTSRSFEDIEVLSFKEEDLKNATKDLMFLMARLIGVMHLQAHTVIRSLGDKQFDTWRYKRILPSTPNQPPKQKKNRAHARLPRA